MEPLNNSNYQKAHHIMLCTGKVIYYVFNIVILGTLSLLFGNFSIFVIGLISLTVLCCFLPNELFSGNNTLCMLLLSLVIFGFFLLAYYGLIEKYGKPYYANDDEKFEAYGLKMFNQNVFIFADLPYISGLDFARGYLIPLAWIYRVSSLFDGYHTVIPRVVNIYSWFFISMLVFRIIRGKGISLNTSFKCFAILTAFPNALYISSFVYRDVYITLLLVVFYYSLEKILSNRIGIITIGYGIIIAYCSYAMYYTRMQMLFVFIGLAAFMIVTNLRKKGKDILNPVTVIIAIMLAVLLLFVTGGFKKLNSTSSFYSEYILSSDGGLSQTVFSTPLFPFGFLLRIVYGYMVPFPGEILRLNYFGEPLYSVIQFLVCLGTIFQIVLFPYLLRQAIKLKRDIFSFLIVYASIVLTTFTFRHFVMMYPFLAIVAASEYDEVHGDRFRKIYMPMIFLIVFAGILYLVLKMM